MTSRQPAPYFAEIAPYRNTISDLDTKITQHLDEGFNIEIKHSWDGKPIDHDPIKISMKWFFQRQQGKPHKRVVKVHVISPLFDDPEPELPGGICPGLWNYECVELFFSNSKGHYLEVELGPHGHWLCLLHNGFRKCFNKGEELELEVQNEFRGTEWHCFAEIPLAYFPGNISKFNAYAIHGLGTERQYESLHSVTDGTLKEPDFHDLQFFGSVDTRYFIPEGYNRHPFNDLKYGDLWEDVTKGLVA